jgi:crossover junction endodeoxyribonuclease RuvC
LAYVSSGSVKTFAGELPSRLKLILSNLSEVITQYQPEHVAIEQVFVNINPKTTLLLGQARGAAICAAVMNNLMVTEYTALQIKQAVVGNGHAKKNQVQGIQAPMLRMLWLAPFAMRMAGLVWAG